MDVNNHIGAILEVHFDARWGAPYWIDARKHLPFDPLAEVLTSKDLSRFPPFPLVELSTRPVTHFIPRKYHDRLAVFISSETGGATGAPKRTAFLEEEFRDAFVTPFLRAATFCAFPRNQHWLFIGPSGPHIIGKAARACATAMGSIDPFTVDFDPRWVRKLPRDSLARARYVEHVLEQALAVLHSQDIGVLFATPPILEALGTRLSDQEREAILGVHLGGMSMTAAFMEDLARWFPHAAIMSGYGNSLMGMCPQLSSCGGLPCYFPHGNRLQLEVTTQDSEGVGQVRFHRLDHSVFLPNVVERDFARNIAAPTGAAALGFHTQGLVQPAPVSTAAAGGLY